MILVTGGSGFIGSHTVRALHGLGEPSVVLQRRSGQVREMRGDLAAAALHHDARLAETVQRADGVRADEPGPSSDENHRAPFVSITNHQHC